MSTAEVEISDRPTGGKLDKRCGSKIVSCHHSNVPGHNICNQLLQYVIKTAFDIYIGAGSPRSICLNVGTSNTCCVSWGRPFGRVMMSKFYPAGLKIWEACVTNAMSGHARDVEIDGKCFSQCLSNRPTGC